MRRRSTSVGADGAADDTADLRAPAQLLRRSRSGCRPAARRRPRGIVEHAGSWTFPLIFNLSRGGPPADVRFRRACALAIDRGAIVQRLLGGHGEPGNPGFLPRDHPFHADVEQYAFDRAAAERLLDDAGYRRPRQGDGRRDRDGQPLRLRLLTGNAPVPPVLDLLIASLAAVGIELEPRAVDLPTLFERTRRAADEAALTLYPGPGGTAPNGDPDLLRTFFSSRIEGRLQGAQGGRTASSTGSPCASWSPPTRRRAGACWRACRRSSRATCLRWRSTTRPSRTCSAGLRSSTGT
ncbi:MAG: ABC transporter substrate-binding protein [Thermoleophilia bacterium]